MLATFLLSCAHLLFYKFLPVLQTGDVQKHLVIILKTNTFDMCNFKLLSFALHETSDLPSSFDSVSLSYR